MTTAPQYAVEHLFPWQSEWTSGPARYDTVEHAKEAAAAKAKWSDAVRTRIVRVETVLTVVEEFQQTEMM